MTGRLVRVVRSPAATSRTTTRVRIDTTSGPTWRIDLEHDVELLAADVAAADACPDHGFVGALARLADGATAHCRTCGALAGVGEGYPPGVVHNVTITTPRRNP